MPTSEPTTKAPVLSLAGAHFHWEPPANSPRYHFPLGNKDSNPQKRDRKTLCSELCSAIPVLFFTVQKK